MSSRIRSRGELYEKAVKPIKAETDEPLVKHHMALLLAWAEERAVEVSQARYRLPNTSLRDSIDTELDAYHDTWYSRAKQLARDSFEEEEERERAVTTTRNDAERMEKAFYALCEVIYAGKDAILVGREFSESMAIVGDDLAYLANRNDPVEVQSRFRALAALMDAAVRARAEGIGAKDGSPLRKYLALHQTVMASAGGIEPQ